MKVNQHTLQSFEAKAPTVEIKERLYSHSITRSKDEEIFERENDNLNLNILQDNEATNSIVPHFQA